MLRSTALAQNLNGIAPARHLRRRRTTAHDNQATNLAEGDESTNHYYYSWLRSVAFTPSTIPLRKLPR
jgi:hypothetical protein